ncbi:MAG: hypothetical protein H6Q06_975 [Acidobacteria bacterium]|jgi:hypothetical protein|nr:hypothetical protein [Acidobacteriota bacterium]
MDKTRRTFAPVPAAAIGFRPEFLDFKRGIRVGNLKDNERITRILKLALESGYGQTFVTERWGRGVFWQWIGYLPRANRDAMPMSSKVSFGCSKFFISMDTEDRLFECGMQVERGYIKAPREFPQCELAPDWDWHRLLRQVKPGGQMECELRRLILREGFRLHAGNWEDQFIQASKKDFPTMTRLRQALKSAPATNWAGFQVYYAFPEGEVLGSTGSDLVDAMLAVFRAVTPVMNLCMNIRLL